MPTFPTFTDNRMYEAPDDQAEYDEGAVEDEAADGSLRRRVRYPSEIFRGTFDYPYLTKTDFANLLVFYNANKFTAFDFPFHDGASETTISVVFKERPKRIKYRNGESLAVRVKVRSA